MCPSSPCVCQVLCLLACGPCSTNTCVYNCPLSRLQPCHAVRPARQWTEVCSLQITPSAHGWPTSAAAATDSPPKSWRPQSASQTAPGATITRYLDASVRAGWGVERLQDREEEGCGESGLPQKHKALLHPKGNAESLYQKTVKLDYLHHNLV